MLTLSISRVEVPNALSLPGWGAPEWVSLVGFPLTLIGLYLAWLQIRSVKTAADAARAAAERTEHHLADNHLLLLIPRLLQASRDLEHAVRLGERGAGFTFLGDWRELAVQVRTLVERQGGRPGLRESIDRAIALIPPAEDALQDTTADAYSGTRHARDRIRDACDAANEIVTERMAFVDRNKKP